MFEGYAFSAFIGRTADLDAVRLLLGSRTLVTVTGAGGVGKTRLVHELLRTGTGLDATVDLVPLGSADPGVPSGTVIAESIGLRTSLEMGELESLVAYWRHRPHLLVLDGVEQTADDVAFTVAYLAERCPGLRILTTSRHPLGFSGEAVHRLAPLATRGAVPTDAARLFIDRVSAFNPTLRPEPPEQALIEQIVSGLDGLPLGVELAAAMARSLSLAELAELVEGSLLRLGGEVRGHERHQSSLRLLVSRSLDELTAQQRARWVALAIFPDSFDARAALAVLHDEGDITDTQQELADLAERSLLERQPDESDGSLRFRMLATLRAVAKEALDQSPEVAEVRRRYVHRYSDWAGSVAARWFGAEQQQLSRELWQEHRNILEAIEVADSAVESMRIVAHLRFHWTSTNRLLDVRRWISDALPHLGEDPALRFRVLWTDCWLAVLADDRGSARRRANELTRDVRRRPDAAAEDVMDAEQMALATMLWDKPQSPTVLPRLRQLVTRRTAEGDAGALADDLFFLGVAEMLAGDLEVAQATAASYEALCSERGEYWNRGYAAWLSAVIAWQRGDVELAAARATQGVATARVLSERSVAAICASILALVDERSDQRRAAMLLGAAERAQRISGLPLVYWDLADISECRTRLTEEFGAERFARLLEQGAKRGIEELVLGTNTQPQLTHTKDLPLTSRQRTIASLIADGSTNAEIARDLQLSVRTVEKHVENALMRLGLRTRSQLAAWITKEEQDASGS